jgi:hypothetical protein
MTMRESPASRTTARVEKVAIENRRTQSLSLQYIGKPARFGA